jgi:pilus assembly protein TadC
MIDLIITKMSRGTGVDMDDCVAVFATGKVDAETLLREYLEAARYDLNPKRMVNNFLRLTEKLRAAGLVTDQFLGKVRATL